MEQENREQPETIDVAQGAEAQESEGEILSSDGSLGKFKDAQSLYSAYNNLQAEFTRKCQKLSELEKTSVLNQDVQATPVYKSEDWNKQVSKFLEDNQDAKLYAKEICDEIASDEHLATSSDALNLAWANVIKKNYTKPSDIDSDEFINKYVLSNEKVKQKVMQSLAKQISEKNIPTLVGTHAGSHINFQANSQPLTMADAKELVRKMIE